MSEKCPKCGSGYFGVREDDTCLSCGWHRQSLFDRITASPEVLAPRFIYFSYRRWRSSLLPGMKFWKYPEAFAATVAQLKEVCDE